MVELITVMIIAGVLAAVAIPRIFDNSAFQSRGFYDQVISTLRYAQKAAIAQNRYVCVAFTASSITLTYGTTNACGSNLANLAGSTPYTVSAPSSNVILSGYTPFNFDALGKPSFATAQSITVSGYASSVTVETETGYVH